MLKGKLKHRERSPIHLVKYPADPLSLPKLLYDAAYVDEEPTRTGGELGLGTAGFACRKTNTLVRDSASAAGASSQPHMAIMQQSMAMMQQMMHRVLSGQSSDSLSNLEVFPNKRRKTRAIEAPLVEPTETIPLPAPSAASSQAQQNLPPTASSQAQQEGLPSRAESKDMFDLPVVESAKQRMSPEEQQRVMKETQQARETEKKRDKSEQAEVAAQSAPKAKAGVKALSKAKAKGVGEAKAAAKAKAKAQAKAKAKTQAAPVGSETRQEKKARILRSMPKELRKKWEKGCSSCRFVSECTLSCWAKRGYS